MGGYGSGRRFGRTKDTVEDCWSLDTNWLTKQGILRPGRITSGSIRWTHSATDECLSTIGYEVNVPARWLRLHYRLTNLGESFDCRISLTTTTLPWSGVRWWFICPLVIDGRSCARRVGNLYLPGGGRYYGCRRCYDLTYQSCNESHKFDRLWDRMADDLGMDPATVRAMMRKRP